ncbi:DUF7373 family lipoprotein [Nocardia asteroides]|uniref:DUF7373 family lipoprotein n=1 Tax=Nocardia asteroides TaxID=1824 RepID=UPI001E4D6430|nr:hypothetical protein [Nocardia asteroides]UGT60037.1 hypothetical protein LTT61_22835 [Nocardia asteroides]
MTHRYRLLAVLLGTLTLLAGCGKVDGVPTAAEIDVRPLDVGNYPTTPLEFRYEYGHSLFDSTRLAAMRIADTMVTGTEIDANFHYLLGSSALLSRDDVEDVLANANGPVTERNGMIVGFGVTVGTTDKDDDPKKTSVTVVVLQFPDAATAERTARELEQTDFDVAPDLNQRVNIPNIPAAHAHWRPGVPTLGAFMAKGSYVISAFTEASEPDLSNLTDLSRRALENQGRLLDGAPALSGEEMLRLENDPEGMLNRTLNPEASGAPSPRSQLTLTRRGLATQLNQQYDRGKILDDAGVDRYAKTGSFNASQTFRTRDAAAALALGEAVLGWGFTEPADAPDGIPGVRCGARTNNTLVSAGRYRCTVPYQRYLASVESDQIVDLHQRAAAQYALLANSY